MKEELEKKLTELRFERAAYSHLHDDKVIWCNSFEEQTDDIISVIVTLDGETITVETMWVFDSILAKRFYDVDEAITEVKRQIARILLTGGIYEC